MYFNKTLKIFKTCKVLSLKRDNVKMALQNIVILKLYPVKTRTTRGTGITI